MKWFKLKFFSLSFALLIAQPILAEDGNSMPLTPPIAKKVPKITEINGATLVDNYYWLLEKNNPDVIKYLEEENHYTDAIMKPTEKLQQHLYLKTKYKYL